MIDITLQELLKNAEDSFNKLINEGLSENEAIDNTIDKIIDTLSKLDLPQEFVNENLKLIKENYEGAISSGHSQIEALNNSIEKLHQNIDDYNENNSISESNINLDFAITGDSPRLELMNEAMAKGLSVEDAIKYVNNKLNHDSSEFGPPTLAEFNKINENTTQTSFGKENQEINKIEATMDAEANKKIPDNTLSDKNIIDDNKILHESNLDKNDDEIS